MSKFTLVKGNNFKIFTSCCCCLFSAKRWTMSVKLLCGLLGVLLMSQLAMSADSDSSDSDDDIV